MWRFLVHPRRCKWRHKGVPLCGCHCSPDRELVPSPEKTPGSPFLSVALRSVSSCGSPPVSSSRSVVLAPFSLPALGRSSHPVCPESSLTLFSAALQSSSVSLASWRPAWCRRSKQGSCCGKPSACKGADQPDGETPRSPPAGDGKMCV